MVRAFLYALKLRLRFTEVVCIVCIISYIENGGGVCQNIPQLLCFYPVHPVYPCKFPFSESKSLKRLAQVSAMQDEPDDDGCADEGRDRIQRKNVLTARQMGEQIG